MAHRKTRFPTTTVHQARLQLYQPTRRPKAMTRVIETSWGKAEVTGKIGQGHADIIESLFYHAMDSKPTEIGGLLLLVDPYKLRKSIGGGKQYAGKQTWEMLQGLRDIRIDLTAKGFRAIGGIVDYVEESDATLVAHNGLERHLWRIAINPAFVKIMAEDLPLSYDPAPLSAISTGVSQAIARLVLTHKDQPNGGWLLDELIKAVGAGSDSELRNRRRDVHGDIENLAKIGVLIEGNRVFNRG